MTSERTSDRVFAELEQLCHEAGFLHAISLIQFRDLWLVEAEHRHSRARLNHNEIMLLVGLLVQSNTDEVFSRIGDVNAQVAHADRLLEELHVIFELPTKEAIQATIATQKRSGEGGWDMGKFLMEAIYYGAQSPFDFQYLRLARNRYRQDADWMQRNKGIAIRSILEIANGIIRQITIQVSTLAAMHKDRHTRPTPGEISNAMIFEKEALIRSFGQKASRFLDLFSIPINSSNESFTSPLALNETTYRPLLDLGQHVYLSNQFKLAESIYESPFYWMNLDTNYRNAAAEHRGGFLETTIYKLLARVFGEKNVFSNVTIRKNKAEIAAEADVIVIFGEFVLVIQAKSKRLTLAARAGNFEAIAVDLNKAVQLAYDQSVIFVDLLLNGAECVLADGKTRQFDFVTRVFPIVVLSENFPSLSLLVNDLIKVREDISPAVIDIFFLDVLCQILTDPVEILYYLQQRTRYFPKLHTDRELSVLGFHLKNKLFVSSEYDYVDIGGDFASDIDDYMVDQYFGRASKIKFTKLEERTGVPEIAELISALKAGPPELAGVSIELLDLSYDSLKNIVEQITSLREEGRAGKALKAFSFLTHNAGISYVVVQKLDKRAGSFAEAIGRRHKYAQKRDRWYVLVDEATSPTLVSGIFPILSKWAKSEDMDQAIADLDKIMPTTTTR